MIVCCGVAATECVGAICGGRLMIRFFRSHEEYDKVDAETVMKATLIVIENDADHAEAKALVEKLMRSSEPADLARMTAQARLVWWRLTNVLGGHGGGCHSLI
jgi:hypothetical protein